MASESTGSRFEDRLKSLKYIEKCWKENRDIFVVDSTCTPEEQQQNESIEQEQEAPIQQDAAENILHSQEPGDLENHPLHDHLFYTLQSIEQEKTTKEFEPTIPVSSAESNNFELATAHAAKSVDIQSSVFDCSNNDSIIFQDGQFIDIADTVDITHDILRETNTAVPNMPHSHSLAASQFLSSAGDSSSIISEHRTNMKTTTSKVGASKAFAMSDVCEMQSNVDAHQSDGNRAAFVKKRALTEIEINAIKMPPKIPKRGRPKGGEMTTIGLKRKRLSRTSQATRDVQSVPVSLFCQKVNVVLLISKIKKLDNPEYQRKCLEVLSYLLTACVRKFLVVK